MPLEQIIVLALVQGITEFLPISSSGHLIILPMMTGWPDQGLVTDVMVHIGSLFAVLVYFWRDVLRMIKGAFDLLRFRWSDEARLTAYIAGATVPAMAFGLFLKTSGLLDTIRDSASLKLQIVGWNAIIFGLLLYVADRVGSRMKIMGDMKFGAAMAIGISQALALIPGTSRSGITITAARFLGFERPEAARFSFLLGIPAISAAGLLTILEAHEKGEVISNDAIFSAGLTFFSALAAIAFLMAIVKRMSFLPFVIYRLMLGAFLLVLAYS